MRHLSTPRGNHWQLAASANCSREQQRGKHVTPREFLEKVVQPNIAEFDANFACERHAYNAVAAVDSLTAHIYVWCKDNAPKEIAGIGDDTMYRQSLARSFPDFGLLRDIAKAQKHVHLDRGKLEVTTASQVTARSIGWGEGRFGEGRWGGPPQVVVTTDNGILRYVEQIVAASLTMLEAEMTRLKI
jgi:hypothetical protein